MVLQRGDFAVQFSFSTTDPDLARDIDVAPHHHDAEWKEAMQH